MIWKRINKSDRKRVVAKQKKRATTKISPNEINRLVAYMTERTASGLVTSLDQAIFDATFKQIKPQKKVVTLD